MSISTSFTSGTRLPGTVASVRPAVDATLRAEGFGPDRGGRVGRRPPSMQRRPARRRRGDHRRGDGPDGRRQTNRFSARAIALLLVALVAVAVAGCAGSVGSTVQKVGAAKAVGMLDSRVVIDVRTQGEYAAGHIAGAQNIDVEAADFASKIASLDKEAAYLVYCQSGRRSGIAAAQMASAGFTDIVDGGAMADLVAAGAPAQ